MKTGIKSEEEIAKMERIEDDFNRLEWKKKNVEKMVNASMGLDEIVEIHEWDEYVSEKWDFTHVQQNDY